MTSLRDIQVLLDGGAGARGTALFILQKTKRAGGSPALKRLCEEIAAAKRDRSPLPDHPARLATRERYQRPNDEELSPVELLWLQRLPQDPTQVTFEQAARLAGLAASISPSKSPASARLIESIWEPVKALHDRRLAEARLQQATKPLPALPKGALPAITELLVLQHPGVSETALEVQAQEMLAEYQSTRQATHERSIREAETAIATIDERSAQRASLDGQGAA